MTQTVSFIGSGAIGGGLARLAVKAGWNVVLSNSRGPATLAGLVAELGSLARAATPEEAARQGDLVVASVPFKDYKSLPADALAGKVVIDTMNYYPLRDGDVPELDKARAITSPLVQKHLKKSRVVKALHNLEYRRLLTSARPAGSPDRRALPIAGDDAAAKQKVAQFMDAIGYDAVDIGTLADSWRCGPASPLYVIPYIGTGPAGMTPEEAKRWFINTPGVAVSASEVKELAAKAVLHDKMWGTPEALPPGMRDVMMEERAAASPR